MSETLSLGVFSTPVIYQEVEDFRAEFGALASRLEQAKGILVRMGRVLRPSKFEGHCPMIRHGCRMALMVALNWSVECVKEES